MNAARTIKVIVDARQAEQGARKYEKAVGGMAKAGASANKSMKGLDVALKSTRRSFSNALLSLNAFSSSLLALGGASLGLNSLVGTLAGFEDTMQTVQSVTRATSQEFELLRNRAKELGGSTRFSATEAAQGFVNLSRAGFDVNESLEAINGTLDLASSAGISLSESSGVVSNSLRQFGLSASSTNMVVDTLVGTSNRANTTVSQLAAGLEVVGPIANSIGLSIGKTSAALGVLADSGIQGSKAGTGLRTVIAQLVKPTEQAKEVFDRLGLSARELNPEFNSIDDIFQKLSNSGLSATDAFKIFGNEGSSVALVLSKGYQRMRDLNDEVAKAGGEASRTAQAMSQTLGGSLRALGSAVEALILNMGDAGLGFALKSIIQTTTQALQVLGGMESAVSGNSQAARLLAEGFELVAAAAVGFGVAKLVTGFLSMSSAIGAATASTNLLTVAMAANPAGALAAAFGVAAAAVYVYRDSLIEVNGVTVTVGDFGLSLAQQVGVRLKIVARNIGIVFSGLKDLFNAAKSSASSAFESIMDNFGGVITGFGKALKVGVNILLGVLDSIVQSFINAVKNFLQLTKAVAEFDFSKPTESAKRFNDAFNKAVNPISMGLQFSQQFKESLSKDFVGDAFQVGKNWKKQLIAGIRSSPEIQEGLDNTINLLSPSKLIDDASREAARAAKKRSDVKNFAPIQGEVTALIINPLAGFFGSGSNSEQAKRDALSNSLDRSKSAQDAYTRSLQKSTKAGPGSDKSAKDEGFTFAGDINDQIISEYEALGLTDPLVDFEASGIKFGDTVDSAISNQDRYIRAVESSGDAVSAAAKHIENSIRRAKAATNFNDTLVSPDEALGLQNPIIDFTPTGIPFGSANGNVFTGGARLMPFANGGVFDQPATFAMADGRTGLAFEAGPEAIMPLARDSQGRLGVRQQGGEGPRTVVNQTYRINVQTPNPDAFRMAPRQIERRARRSGGS